jgi:hypothetical protein
VLVGVGVRVGVGVLLGKIGVIEGVNVGPMGELSLKFSFGSAVESGCGVNVGGTVSVAAAGIWATGINAGAAKVGNIADVVQADRHNWASNRNNNPIAVLDAIRCMCGIIYGWLFWVNHSRTNSLLFIDKFESLFLYLRASHTGNQVLFGIFVSSKRGEEGVSDE